jgi:hypothetical protein
MFQGVFAVLAGEEKCKCLVTLRNFAGVPILQYLDRVIRNCYLSFRIFLMLVIPSVPFNAGGHYKRSYPEF